MSLETATWRRKIGSQPFERLKFTPDPIRHHLYTLQYITIAPKRLASTAPTPLRRSKRLAQPIVEEPSELSAHEDVDKPLDTWSLREDGDYEEDDEAKEEGGVEVADAVQEADNNSRQKILRQINLPSDLLRSPVSRLFAASEASADMKVAI